MIILIYNDYVSWILFFGTSGYLLYETPGEGDTQPSSCMAFTHVYIDFILQVATWTSVAEDIST